MQLSFRRPVFPDRDRSKATFWVMRFCTEEIEFDT